MTTAQTENIKTDRQRREEYYAIARGLEKHHNLFYELWARGAPVFDDSIPTACVEFDQKSFKPFVWKFNPEFWDSCSEYKKTFVIAHEMLHIILSHGQRAKSLTHISHDLVNGAMDLAINHLLINSFDFDRSKVEGWDDYWWVDVAFPKGSVSDTLCFEEYLDILKSESQGVAGGAGAGAGRCGTVDYHEIMISDDIIDEVNKIIQKMPVQDVEDFEGEVKKHLPPPHTDIKSVLKIKPLPLKIQPSKQWEKIIKKAKRKNLIENAEGDQWIKPSRRYTDLPEDFILPCEDETLDENFAPAKVNIALFMDISGSCTKYVDHFLRACRSIPKKRFKKFTFVFDTRVTSVNVDKYIPRSGGFTSFTPIIDEVEKLQKDKVKFDYVFVITDGQADDYTYKKTCFNKRWHWFLIDYSSNYKHYGKMLEKHGGVVHNLDHFFVYKKTNE